MGRAVADIFTGGLAEIGFQQADKAKKEAASANAAAAAAQQQNNTPSVNQDAGGATDPAKLRRIGRAALIQTSPQGILGNASTGRSALSAI